jgi:hypothetical protein
MSTTLTLIFIANSKSAAGTFSNGSITLGPPMRI